MTPILVTLSGFSSIFLFTPLPHQNFPGRGSPPFDVDAGGRILDARSVEVVVFGDVAALDAHIFHAGDVGWEGGGGGAVALGLGMLAVVAAEGAAEEGEFVAEMVEDGVFAVLHV